MIFKGRFYKIVRGIFNFRFCFVFNKVYIFVQQNVWTLFFHILTLFEYILRSKIKKTRENEDDLDIFLTGLILCRMK